MKLDLLKFGGTLDCFYEVFNWVQVPNRLGGKLQMPSRSGETLSRFS